VSKTSKADGRKTCGARVLEDLWIEVKVFCLKHKIGITEFVESAYKNELERRRNHVKTVKE